MPFKIVYKSRTRQGTYSIEGHIMALMNGEDKQYY